METVTPDPKPAKAKPAPKPPTPRPLTEDQLRCKVDIACGFLDRNVPTHASVIKSSAGDEDIDPADRWKYANPAAQSIYLVPPEIRAAYERALLNAANLVADYFGAKP